jgi:hypothetical protein
MWRFWKEPLERIRFESHPPSKIMRPPPDLQPRFPTSLYSCVCSSKLLSQFPISARHFTNITYYLPLHTWFGAKMEHYLVLLPKPQGCEAYTNMSHPPIVPQENSTKRITPGDWERVRPIIAELYVEQDKTLPEVMRIMAHRHNHHGT